MNGQTNPSKRVDADRLRRAGVPEAMIAEAVARDAKGVLNHEPPADLVARTIKACESEFAVAPALAEVSEPKKATATKWEPRFAHVWKSSIPILIRHGFSPGFVRLFARAALATGGGRHDEDWRARLAALAAYDAEQRPVWVGLAAFFGNPRVRLYIQLSVLCSILVGIVLFVRFARYEVSGRYEKPGGPISVIASTEKLAFPPISPEEGGSPTLRRDSEIYAMAVRFRETKHGAFQP